MKDSSNQITDKHSLAAILFADVQGYTKLMQESETDALVLLAKFKSVFGEKVTAHGGTISQFYGDGCLCVFRSVLDAVRCALACQNELIDDPRVPVRIGIHVGEILQNADNIYGDAVNVASRIESIAKAGSILLSDNATEQIKNKNEFHLHFLGQRSFKNVNQSIGVYEVLQESTVATHFELSKRQVKKWPLVLTIALVSVVLLVGISWVLSQSEKKESLLEEPFISLGIMPFENLSNDKHLSLFGNAMHEEIATQLIRLQSVPVVAREVMQNYVTGETSLENFGSKFKVSHILQGSVRLNENGSRILDTKLMSVESANYIWAITLNEEQTKASLIQKTIAKRVVEGLNLQLKDNEVEEMDRIPTLNDEAYQLYLGASQYFSWIPDSIQKNQIVPLEKCISLDQNFAEAHAALASAYYRLQDWSLENPIEYRRLSRRHTARAVELDPTNPQTLHQQGAVRKIFDLDFLGAEQSYQQVYEVDPHLGLGELIWFYNQMATPTRSLQVLQGYHERYPQNKSITRGEQMWTLALAGQKEEALAMLEEYIATEGTEHFGITVFYLTETLALCGRMEEALSMSLALYSENEVLRYSFIGTYQNLAGHRAEAETYNSKLRSLDENHYVSPVAFAMLAASSGDFDLAFEEIEKSWSSTTAWIMMVPVLSCFQNTEFKNDPRYQALCVQMGLLGH